MEAILRCSSKYHDVFIDELFVVPPLDAILRSYSNNQRLVGPLGAPLQSTDSDIRFTP